MKLRRRLPVALLASSAALLGVAATPAHAASSSPPVHFAHNMAITVGGPWVTDSVTVKNTGDTPLTTGHLYMWFVYGEGDTPGPGQVELQYAEGTGGSWHPVALHTAGGKDPDGQLGDLTGGVVTIAPHSSRTFRLRVRMPQSSAMEPVENFQLQGYYGSLGTTANPFPPDNPYFAGITVRGLDLRITGLPKSIPADGKFHTFHVEISTKNHVDWHVKQASFYIFAGLKNGTWNGPNACDAEIDVMDAKTGAWHRVNTGAVMWDKGDVDLQNWPSGAYGHRVLTVRIAFGGHFRTDKRSNIGFGLYPQSNPDLFWTEADVSAKPVKGAPACVTHASATSPSATSATTPSPSASASSGITAPAATPSSSASAAASLPDTGGGSNAGLIGGGAAVVVLAGAGVAFAARRRAQQRA